MNLTDSKIHIWQIPTLENLAIIDSLIDTFTSDEVRKARRFRFEKDTKVYTSARAALKFLLSDYLGLPVSALKMDKNPFDKPFVTNTENSIHFNLSHTANHIMIAFSRHEVGIDIEYIKPRIHDLASIVKQGHPSEHANFVALPENKTISSFFTWWSRKEAYIKGIGHGVSLGLDKFEVSVHPDAAPVLRQKHELDDGRWSVTDIDAPTGCSGALAFPQSEVDIEYRQFNWDNYLQRLER